MNARRRVAVWVAWHAVVWASFAVLERRALRSGDLTLSEWTRVMLGRRDQARRDRRILAAGFTGLLLWFWGHILLDWGPSQVDGRIVLLRPSQRREGAS